MLKTIIEAFQNELEGKLKAREEGVFTCRKVITLSKQAIMAIHRDEVDEAREKVLGAQTMLREVDTILSVHQDLVLGIVKVAHQEYAEAQILLRLVESYEYPSPHELEVPIIPYLLGLADSIGEFRRRALEALRKRRVEVAEQCLQIMDEIYSELVALESAYTLAPELRRKCDVARRLIEITIGDINAEAGRIALEESIRELEKRVQSR
jgi:translin